MSIAGLDELDLSWTLRNTLTINNDVTVEGDVNTTGAIYDGGIPTTITGDNNVWTGNNLFSNFQPTFIAPVADEDMTTYDYMETTFTGVGANYLPLNNVWTGPSNVMNNGILPIINNQATQGTNEMVNLNTLNAYLATQTGQLNTDNIWTRQNTFTNKVNVPTPLTLAQFGNKTYVDAEITAYNVAGGNIEYQEILTQAGIIAITLDPVTYTGMYVCMVGAGGNGAPGGSVPIPQTLNTFGGAGGYACFKLPAFSGGATLDVNTTTLGSTLFSLNGVLIASATGGNDAVYPVSGTGGVATFSGGLLGGQSVTGQTENQTIGPVYNYSYNSAVLNGYGQGGSFDWNTGTRVNPTGFYCLLIKFEK